jgi:uncharacterized protein YidB (DUF937 family)
MGLFDDFINKATQGNNPSDPLVVALNKLLAGNAPQGGAGRPQSSAAPADSTVGSDSDLISGLNGLLAKLQAAGLGDAVKSWVGTGQNRRSSLARWVRPSATTLSAKSPDRPESRRTIS